MSREPQMGGGEEFRLIERLAARLRRPGAGLGEGAEVSVGIGDDAAVTVPGGATVTSVDALVEGVHFRRDRAPMRSIGHKALATALSDLAAMGAAPGEAYVVLGIPDDLGEGECLELCDGLAALAAETGTAVAGGDVTRAPALMLTVTVVGHVRSPDAAIGRYGAEPGDVLAVTGELGGAAAGLVLLARPELDRDLDDELAAALRGRQLEPLPRLAAGVALAGSGASAMIDLSDGLGADAGHIAAASGVRIEIEIEQVPIQQGVAAVAAAAGLDPEELAAAGGEDYELLVALPASGVDAAARAVSDAGERLTVIGRVTEGEGARIRRSDGSPLTARGFDHLRGGRAAPGPG